MRGTLTDAAGMAIGGAQLYFDGVPPAQSAAIPLYVSGRPVALSDAGGAFGGLVYTMFSSGPLELRGAVVRPGRPDTVFVTAGTARFRYERERPDTVLVDLRIP